MQQKHFNYKTANITDCKFLELYSSLTLTVGNNEQTLIKHYQKKNLSATILGILSASVPRPLPFQDSLLRLRQSTSIHPPAHIHLARARARRSHSQAYFEIQSSTAYYQQSFYPSVIMLWNQLPATAAEAPSLLAFKAALVTVSF